MSWCLTKKSSWCHSQDNSLFLPERPRHKISWIHLFPRWSQAGMFNSKCSQSVFVPRLNLCAVLPCGSLPGVLMMERTCSEKVELLIPLNQVCRTERNGNGYLCMCAKDFCNGASTIYSSGYFYILSIGMTLICLVHKLNTRVFWCAWNQPKYIQDSVLLRGEIRQTFISGFYMHNCIVLIR